MSFIFASLDNASTNFRNSVVGRNTSTRKAFSPSILPIVRVKNLSRRDLANLASVS